MRRGVDRETASRVTEKMMAHDALATHPSEELGNSDLSAARPLRAAITSAATFSVGAALPLAFTALRPPAAVTLAVASTSSDSLALLGAIAAGTDGSRPVVGAARVAVWGHWRWD